MPLLDTIKQMQEQQIAEPDIIQSLREQGISEKEISEALSQSKIKAAVSESDNNVMKSLSQEMPGIPEPPAPSPSIASQEYQEAEPFPESMPVQAEQQAYQYPEQAYPGYEYYQPQQTGTSAETVTDIAEQIVGEKISEIKKLIGNVSDFKAMTESKISSIDERLKKIETIIEKLQESLIEKLGNYGQAVEDIKDELGTIEESFSKAISPIVEKAKHVTETRHEPRETHETKHESHKKRRHAMEEYLRR